VKQTIEHASRDGKDFEHEYRRDDSQPIKPRRAAIPPME
jgi:hypothetical protein